MSRIVYNYKAIELLLFLYTYLKLLALNGIITGCSGSYDRITRNIEQASQIQVCKESSEKIAELLKSKNAYMYLKLPELGDEYLDYYNTESRYYGLEETRKERAIPIDIKLNGILLNPRKEEKEKYLASSKIKERIISENITITKKNCTFMAVGSEYLFPIPATEGRLRVILYFDYIKDLIYYRELIDNPGYSGPKKYFDQFIHRGLEEEVNFKPGKIYQIEIKINPNSAIPRGSYNATSTNIFESKEKVPGFTITLKELPSNTKFAFDGKDDVGKTYEQVKKEFILYDHTEEAKKE